MAQVLATVFCLFLLFLLQLANFWFTYGIWPLSWLSFALCWMGTVMLSAMLALLREGK